jgi:O-antigen/teichoic acid export membrane protein
MARSLALDILVFSSSRYLLIGLSVVRNLVLARALGPADYGMWIVLTLLLGYGDQIHLGLRHLGDKEIPFLRGRDGEQAALHFANILLGGILLLAVLGSMMLVTYVVVVGTDNSILTIAICLCSLVILSDQVNRYYLMILRTRSQFVFSSKVEVMFELVRTIFVIVLAWLLRLEGAVVAFLISSVSQSCFLLLHLRSQIRPVFDLKRMWFILPKALPFFLSGLLYLLIISLDRIVGTAVLSKVDLGLLGLAMLLISLPVNAAQAVKDVLYPSLSEEFGREGNLKNVLPMYLKSLSAVSVVVPFLVAFIYFSADFLVRWFLPAYRESISLMAILSNGIYFLSLAALPSGFLMATGRNRTYLALQAITIFLTLIAYGLMVMQVGGVVALCYAACISFFLFASLVLYATLSRAEKSMRFLFIRILEIFVPSLYSMLLVFLLISWCKIETWWGIATSLEMTILRLFLFTVLYAPLAITLEQRMKLFKHLREVVRGNA